MNLKKLLGLAILASATTGAFAAPTELFISEYIEGSSSNKAIEIFNGTGSSVNLGTYSVEVYSNGATYGDGANYTEVLAGSLADGDVYVISNSSAALTGITSNSDLTSTITYYNGDDAVVLKNGTTVIDVIGQVGTDPGSAWSANGVSTGEMTLVRMSSIEAGDANGDDAFDPSVEWIGYPQNTDTYIGAHSLVAAASNLIKAYSIDGDTILAVLDVAPASAPGTGDFTLVDSASAATISAVNATAVTTQFEVELSAALADTSADSLQYDDDTLGFIGGISSIVDINAGTIAAGNVVTVAAKVVGVDGSDIAIQQEPAAVNCGLYLYSGSVGGVVAVDEDVVLAGETLTYTDGGGSTRNQLDSPTLISNAAGSAATVTAVAAASFVHDGTAGVVYEGMLIKIDGLTVIDDTPGFGQVLTNATDSSAVWADDTLFTYSYGTELVAGTTYDITGIAWEGYGNYTINPREAADIEEVTPSSVTNWNLF
jgi:uncharacterized protein